MKTAEQTRMVAEGLVDSRVSLPPGQTADRVRPRIVDLVADLLHDAEGKPSRDQLAAAVLPGILSNPEMVARLAGEGTLPLTYAAAQAAHDFAEALLVERGRRTASGPLVEVRRALLGDVTLEPTCEEANEAAKLRAEFDQAQEQLAAVRKELQWSERMRHGAVEALGLRIQAERKDGAPPPPAKGASPASLTPTPHGEPA